MEKLLSKFFVLLSCVFLWCTMYSCDKDSGEDSYGPNNNEENIDGESVDKGVTTPLVKISLEKKNGMHLHIKFDISSDVEYYYVGLGDNISEKHKRQGSRTIYFEELYPGKTYTVTCIPYTSGDKRNTPVQAKFKTATSPYTNYLCRDGEFYEFTGGKATVWRNPGANTKVLWLYISDTEYVQFNYSVHQWEGMNSTWYPGVYKLTLSASYYEYEGFYKNEKKMSKGDVFDGGTLKISNKNGMNMIDFESYGTSGYLYIGHISDYQVE